MKMGYRFHVMRGLKFCQEKNTYLHSNWAIRDNTGGGIDSIYWVLVSEALKFLGRSYGLDLRQILRTDCYKTILSYVYTLAYQHLGCGNGKALKMGTGLFA